MAFEAADRHHLPRTYAPVQTPRLLAVTGGRLETQSNSLVFPSQNNSPIQLSRSPCIGLWARWVRRLVERSGHAVASTPLPALARNPIKTTSVTSLPWVINLDASDEVC